MRVNGIINQDYCIKELQQLLRDMTSKNALSVTRDVYKPHQCKKKSIFSYFLGHRGNLIEPPKTTVKILKAKL